MEASNSSENFHLGGHFSETLFDNSPNNASIKVALFLVGTVIQACVIFIGVLGNAINIVIFLRMKLRDSIALCFFVLSCSDLLSLSLLFALRYVTDFPLFLPDKVRMDGLTLVYVIVYYYLMIYDVSQMVTSYIALQKCCCVALPFTFRATFTRLRSAVVMASITVLATIMYFPIFTAQGVKEVKVQEDNSTLLTLWTTPSRSDVIVVVNFWGILLPSVCQVIVVGCLIVLASSLKSSSRLHNSLSVNPNDRIPPERRVNKSSKEMQAVYVTSFVSLIYVLCNTPRLMISYASLIQPEFNLLKLYSDIYIMFNIFRNTVEAVNASLNIFVFIAFNRNYRRTLFAFKC